MEKGDLAEGKCQSISAIGFFVLRHKIIKWWAQSFLPGVSRIVAGYRGPDGTVVGLETFETMKIFQLTRVSLI